MNISRLKWWTGEVEDGHWVLVVSKAEIQLGFDPWGYPPGELKAKTFSLLPNPPSLITIEQLMNELSILPGKPSRGLRKAIERNLRQLREEGVARSVRFDDDTLRFGYHRVTGTQENAEDEKAKPATDRKILRVRPKQAKAGTLRIGLQQKVASLLPVAPAACTAAQLAAVIESECRLKAGEALKAVAEQLQNLHRMKLAQPVVTEGADDVGWCRTGA